MAIIQSGINQTSLFRFEDKTREQLAVMEFDNFQTAFTQTVMASLPIQLNGLTVGDTTFEYQYTVNGNGFPAEITSGTNNIPNNSFGFTKKAVTYTSFSLAMKLSERELVSDQLYRDAITANLNYMADWWISLYLTSRISVDDGTSVKTKFYDTIPSLLNADGVTTIDSQYNWNDISVGAGEIGEDIQTALHTLRSESGYRPNRVYIPPRLFDKLDWSTAPESSQLPLNRLRASAGGNNNVIPTPSYESLDIGGINDYVVFANTQGFNMRGGITPVIAKERIIPQGPYDGAELFLLMNVGSTIIQRPGSVVVMKINNA